MAKRQKAMRINPELARIGRLKLWIFILCLIPSGAALYFGEEYLAAGLAAGGALALANLLATEKVVDRFLEGSGLTRIVAGLAQAAKLGITALVIALLIRRQLVSPAGLLLGLSTLVAAIMIDIFLFPDKKGSEQSDQEEN